MKNKYLVTIIAILIIIAAVITTVIIVMNPDKEEVKGTNDPTTIKVDGDNGTVEKVKIQFDSDGGNTIQPITIKKGEGITLPTPEKEGYSFLGWYLDGKKIEDGTIFEGDTTLIAKWEIVKQEVKKFVVTFDSKGGSTVNKVEVECGKNLKLPKAPTKSGYTFVSWEDKNGKVIHNDAKLSCENITLYANWEKNKTYSCPDGYKLNGTKCTSEVAVKEKCGERGYDYDGKCVTITGTARKDTQRACPKENVTYMSYAGLTDGKVVNWGLWGCAYYKTNDTSKENCESHGFKWVTPENACYVKWVSNSTINSCDHLSGYAYITEPNNYEGVNGLNGGCFPLSDKEKYCDSGYTLTNGKCIKTIDATLK